MRGGFDSLRVGLREPTFSTNFSAANRNLDASLLSHLCILNLCTLYESQLQQLKACSLMITSTGWYIF